MKLPAEYSLLQQEIRFEQDVVLTRQRARQLATLLGFDAQDQTRIATAVSEIARNAFQYAGGGKVIFAVHNSPGQRSRFVIQIRDQGKGITHLEQILRSEYVSPTGMGMGIVGARRLMDDFRIESMSPGTLVTMAKLLGQPLKLQALRQITDELTRQAPQTPYEEVQQQNRELLKALDDVQQQKHELTILNQELQDTNRGVVALYAELDERAFSLARANDVKTRFLSNMTHEFRTPLNSILSLTRLLLDRLDGELTAEQERQVEYIRKSAEDLSELVNDLLDLAKVEAGKVMVKPHEFTVSDLFGALRGMLKPLLASNTSVNLTFESVDHLPPLHTDEAKVSQILRNFISNALKYTEKGEVRVGAQLSESGMMLFSVSDTGIGIAAEDQERIFEEYTQLDSPLQRRSRGTGLGLPLSRKLAVLLGGNIFVKSRLGEGSVFYAVVAREYQGPAEVSFVPELSTTVDPSRRPILVVEDNRESLFVYEKLVRGAGYQVIPARTISDGHELLRRVRPVAIILDVLLQNESTWTFLADIKQDPATRDIPVFMITMVENEAKALSLGANAFHKKPVERAWLLEKLQQAAQQNRQRALLIIDDNEVSRYLLKSSLGSTSMRFVEAENAQDGLRRATEEHPSAIVLDLGLPDMEGVEALERLKADPSTRDIPVIIHSARPLSAVDRQQLNKATAVVSKDSPSPEIMRSQMLAALSHAGIELAHTPSIKEHHS